ncbi:hypothetical protein SORBI_3006G128266 [Sorghum bicolor]|uniref:Uncharacterized protein n=1 Tax=Sorghum bicolor TaxID=4558 RepID=A0A1Z5RDJ7_SORBI|nr:hypothetical protein SORBI_3006G128266 [Sorghum bicolor]
MAVRRAFSCAAAYPTRQHTSCSWVTNYTFRYRRAQETRRFPGVRTATLTHVASCCRGRAFPWRPRPCETEVKPYESAMHAEMRHLEGQTSGAIEIVQTLLEEVRAVRVYGLVTVDENFLVLVL